LWGQLEDVFRKMEQSPYIPYWLKLVDSITQSFSSEKPKAIFLPYETGPLALAFIIAASSLGIKTIGIQHGIITEYESAYSHQKIASKDFPLGFIIPNKLLLFGKITKEILIQNNYPEERLEIFGNPIFFHLEKIMKFLNPDILYEKYGVEKNQKVILFIPPALIEYYESGDKYNYNIKVWEQLLKDFHDKPDYQVILKAHPRDNLSLYEKTLSKYESKNFKIEKGNILELITISSLVVSTTSNAIIDSLCLKKPVIQVNFENLETQMPYDKFGVVILTTLNTLSREIQKILNDENEQINLIKKSEIFIKNFYNIPEEKPENMLKKILHES